MQSFARKPCISPTGPYLVTLLKLDKLVLKCKDVSARVLQPTFEWMSTAAENPQTVPYRICTYGGAQLAGSFRFPPVVNLSFTLNLSKSLCQKLWKLPSGNLAH